MKKRSTITIACLTAVLLTGCWHKSGISLDNDAGGTDSDSDNDTDVDSDSDSDSDSDGDTDTWPNGDTAPDGYGDVTDVCWVTTFWSESDDTGRILVRDMVGSPGGASTVVGNYRGTAVFGSGEANETLLDPSPGPYPFDGFVARFAADGQLEWATGIGATGSDDPDVAVVAVDRFADDGVAVLGHFAGTVVFGEGEPNETVLVSAGADDFFLARYDSGGQLVWARRDGGDTVVQAHGMAVLPDDSIAVTGHYNDDVIFGEGELHETELEAPYGSTLFLARFFSTGDLAWVQPEGGLMTGPKLAVHQDGHFLISGYGMGDLTFGAGQPNETTLTWDGPIGDWEFYDPAILFWVSFEADGTLRWARDADSDFFDINSSAISLSDGSYAISGWFYNSLAFGLGEPDEIVLWAPTEADESTMMSQPAVFLARIGEEGDYLWALGSNSGIGNSAQATNAASLPGDLILISGSFRGAVNFGLGDPEETWLVTSGDSEPFAAAYDDDGNLAWVARLGSSWSGEGGAAALAGLDDGTFLVAGGFEGQGEFVDGETDEPILIEAQGETDGFLLHVCP